jgi:hypothetical protein
LNDSLSLLPKSFASAFFNGKMRYRPAACYRKGTENWSYDLIVEYKILSNILWLRNFTDLITGDIEYRPLLVT